MASFPARSVRCKAGVAGVKPAIIAFTWTFSLRRLLLETLALARQIADWAAEAKAEDIVVLDVRKATYLADYFVILTATSDRHMVALAERIEDQVSHAGIEPYHVEGTPDSGWLLVDYGDVVVHIFSAPVREFYRLDKVWSDATAILHVL